jgi:hypothetical protein
MIPVGAQIATRFPTEQLSSVSRKFRRMSRGILAFMGRQGPRRIGAGFPEKGNLGHKEYPL